MCVPQLVAPGREKPVAQLRGHMLPGSQQTLINGSNIQLIDFYLLFILF